MRKEKEVKFIESEYYDLRDVHEYNLFLDTIEPMTAHEEEAQKLLEMNRQYLPYDKIEEYVPGSKKYIDIMEQAMKGRVAKAWLKEVDFKSEKILYRGYPQSLELYKHTYQVGYPSGWDNDYDGYEWHFPPGNRTFTFYSRESYPKELVTNLKKLKLPYERGERHASNSRDLIADALSRLEIAEAQIRVYMMAERLGVSYADILEVFRPEKMEFYSRGWHSSHFIIYNGDKTKEYDDKEVLDLIAKAKKAHAKKYVKEDRFVEYPRYHPYIEFLEILDKGEYSEYDPT